jgi:hypothetical protein
MTRRSILLIAFHGVLLIVIGMLVGLPFTEATPNHSGPEVQRAWRVAHTSLMTSGTLFLALAAVARHPVLARTGATFITRSLIISAYAFSFAFVVGPAVGRGGSSPQGRPRTS